MHSRSILTLFTLFAAVTAGCSVEQRQPGPSDTSRSEATPAPAVPDTSSSSTPEATSAGWAATPHGVGPIRIGMSIEQLRQVAGDVPAANASAECSYVRPSAAPPGLLVMLSRGQVVRIDIDSAGVVSDAGVAVGDSVARVTSAYAGRVTDTPHKYVPGGQYLTVRSNSPTDSTRRMVFETEHGHVTRFRLGRIPEVEWVERCG